MTRRFHISFAYIRGNYLDIIETTYDVDGPMDEEMLKQIKLGMRNQMGYTWDPKILGIFELEEDISDEEE